MDVGIKKVVNLAGLPKFNFLFNEIPEVYLGNILTTNHIKVNGHTFQIGTRIW